MTNAANSPKATWWAMPGVTTPISDYRSPAITDESHPAPEDEQAQEFLSPMWDIVGPLAIGAIVLLTPLILGAIYLVRVLLR